MYQDCAFTLAEVVYSTWTLVDVVHCTRIVRTLKLNIYVFIYLLFYLLITISIPLYDMYFCDAESWPYFLLTIIKTYQSVYDIQCLYRYLYIAIKQLVFLTDIQLFVSLWEKRNLRYFCSKHEIISHLFYFPDPPQLISYVWQEVMFSLINQFSYVTGKNFNI